jgi:hypothetical protein
LVFWNIATECEEHTIKALLGIVAANEKEVSEMSQPALADDVRDNQPISRVDNGVFHEWYAGDAARLPHVLEYQPGPTGGAFVQLMARQDTYGLY